MMRRRRVLVVDDTRFFRAALSGMLREQGWEVLEAQDGRVALEIARTELPALDIMILDMQMPEVDGFEVLQQLRSDEAGRKVPVLALSGAELPSEEIERLHALGATDYINKADGLPQVGERLQKLLGDPAMDQAEPGE